MPLRALLIRFPGGIGGTAAAALSRFGFGAAGTFFELEPLFTTGPITGIALSAAAPIAQWYLARPRGQADDVNLWDVAHHVIDAGAALAAAGATPGLIEPDLLQDWPVRQG